MDFPLIYRSPTAPSTSFCSSRVGVFDFLPASLKTAAAVKEEEEAARGQGLGGEEW